PLALFTSEHRSEAISVRCRGCGNNTRDGAPPRAISLAIDIEVRLRHHTRLESSAAWSLEKHQMTRSDFDTHRASAGAVTVSIRTYAYFCYYKYLRRVHRGRRICSLDYQLPLVASSAICTTLQYSHHGFLHLLPTR